MARGRKPVLSFKLSTQQEQNLSLILKDESCSRKVAMRAQTLLLLDKAASVSEVMSELHVTKSYCYRLVKRFQEDGVSGLYDKERSGRPQLFTEEDKSFIRQIACEKPYLVQEGPQLKTWDLTSLVAYLREYGPRLGHPHLKTLSTHSLELVLSRSELSLNVIREVNKANAKAQLLVVPCLYKRLEFLVSSRYDYTAQENVVMMSYNDELSSFLKSEGKVAHPNAVRNSILSLMVGINLVNCEITAFPCFEHDEQNFRQFLDKLSDNYQDAARVNLILDHHKIHDSTNVKSHAKALRTPINFIYELEHPFYINAFENMFSRLMRLNLSSIAAASKDELCAQILKSISRLNACSLVNRWSQDLSEIAYLLK